MIRVRACDSSSSFLLEKYLQNNSYFDRSQGIMIMATNQVTTQYLNTSDRSFSGIVSVRYTYIGPLGVFAWLVACDYFRGGFFRLWQF